MYLCSARLRRLVSEVDSEWIQQRSGRSNKCIWRLIACGEGSSWTSQELCSVSGVGDEMNGGAGEGGGGTQEV